MMAAKRPTSSDLLTVPETADHLRITERTV